MPAWHAVTWRAERVLPAPVCSVCRPRVAGYVTTAGMVRCHEPDHCVAGQQHHWQHPAGVQSQQRQHQRRTHTAGRVSRPEPLHQPGWELASELFVLSCTSTTCTQAYSYLVWRAVGCGPTRLACMSPNVSSSVDTRKEGFAASAPGLLAYCTHSQCWLAGCGCNHSCLVVACSG